MEPPSLTRARRRTATSPLGLGTWLVLACAAAGVPRAPAETSCVDGVDDDGDTLTDCADPECRVLEEPSALDVRAGAIPLVIGKLAGELALRWEPVPAPAYRLWQGSLASLLRGDGYDHLPQLDTPLPAATLPAPAFDAYILVTSSCDDADSSHGRDSFGNERRPPSGSDRDGDTVPDAVDNCPDDANSGQADVDADGAGDACDGLPFLARLTVALEGTGEVAGLQVGVTYPLSLTLREEDVRPIPPLSPVSQEIVNVSVPGRVRYAAAKDVGAVFAPPASVLEMGFGHGDPPPVLLDFALFDCQASDAFGTLLPGVTCAFSGLDLD